MKTQYFMHNAQWDIVSTKIETLNEYHADYDMTFRTIDFTLSFKRKSLYFLLILIGQNKTSLDGPYVTKHKTRLAYSLFLYILSALK